MLIDSIFLLDIFYVMDTHNENMLKERNLSLTSVRLAVLETLQKHPHSEAGRIFDLVKEKITTASKQAIYNNLNTLAKHSILREIKPKGRPSLYETRTGDNHHHIVCRNCDAVMDTNCHSLAPCLKPMENHGFIIDEAEVVFWGICPSCQKSKPKNGE